MSRTAIRLLWTGNWVSRAVENEFKAHGVNLPQGAILLALPLPSHPDDAGRTSGMTTRALMGYAGLTPSGTATQISELVSAGLVERLVVRELETPRDGLDGRQVFYRLTAEGGDRAARITMSLRQLDEALESLVTRKMSDVLSTATTRICEDLQQMPDADSVEDVVLHARRLRAGQSGRGRKDGIKAAPFNTDRDDTPAD